MKDLHVTIFFKEGKACMFIESKDIKILEALNSKIQEWRNS